MYFSKKAFLRCLMHGAYSSFILFFIPWASMQDTVRDDGKDIADYQSFAILVQTCLMVVVTIQVSKHVTCVASVSNVHEFMPELMHLHLPAVSGHPLLDGGQPLLHLGQSGGLLCAHVHHVQQWNVPDLHLLLPLPRSVPVKRRQNLDLVVLEHLPLRVDEHLGAQHGSD